MEKDLIYQHQDFEYRSPKTNTEFFIDKYAKFYAKNTKDSDSFNSFSVLSSIHQYSVTKLETLKEELDKFSERLSSVLIKNEDDLNSDAFQLHQSIKLTARISLSSETIGNFLFGAGNASTLAKDVRKYLKISNLTHNLNFYRSISKAYEKRFLADILHYQIIALDILLERIILYDYPNIIPSFSETENEQLEQFIKEKNSSTGTSTPSDLLRDIFFKLKEVSIESHPNLYTKKGKLIIRKVTSYALEDENFSARWEKQDFNASNGYSFEWLEKKFKEINNWLTTL